MKTLLLIDAHALIHRAFHALPPLVSPEGAPSGALYGVSSMLLKTIKEMQPNYIAAALDRPEPTFRKELFEEYKAHRPPAADELISQIVRAPEIFQSFGIPFFEKPGFEADDIIATFVERFGKNSELRIVILTGDLDTLQLVEEKRIVVETPKKGPNEIFVYDAAAVKERFGLLPEQMPDYKGLVGDISDNIPGVHGIGPKTAAKALQEFKTLERLFDTMPENHPLAKKILPHKNIALFSKKLATVHRDVPVEASLGDLTYHGIDPQKLIPYFTSLGFTSLIQRFLKPLEPKKERVAIKPQSLFEIEKTPVAERVGSIATRNIAHATPKEKIAFNWKEVFKSSPQAVPESMLDYFDLHIAGWLLDPSQKDVSYGALVARFLFETQQEETKETSERLYHFLKGKLQEYELESIFQTIEMPLIPVLAEMELEGIGLSKERLQSLKNDIEKELAALAEEIYKSAGGPFNINSPKQVGAILFEKLKIEAKYKKTPGGGRSTSEEVLQELKDTHPIVPTLLRYREYFKILSGFIEPLLSLCGRDGRIHTTFLQTGTATGRLSSAEPNLQNIPQESQWSRELREGFVARPGYHFLSFDYSQLELRILAHVSGDKKLIQAFHGGVDIHELTASQVFGVEIQNVTKEMRRLGKTLNFGIVYGMGSKAFAKTSGVSEMDARTFIEKYFSTFPGIKTWHEKTIAEARTFGFVKNPHGRRRWFLGILSENPRARAEMERAAINMPIQSMGADITKRAMIESVRVLRHEKFFPHAKLLLSIHDELLFEVRDDILEEVGPLLQEALEKVEALSVPLVAEQKQGKAWGSMKLKKSLL